jgi:hypothetical protein
MGRTHYNPAAGGLQGMEYLTGGASATAVPDQVAVTSTVVWTFIQSMIPQVVNAADFRTIQAFAESFESQSAFKNIRSIKCRAR